MPENFAPGSSRRFSSRPARAFLPRVNAVDPGYTSTDLNGRTGTQTVEDGAAIIVRMAQTAPDGPAGTFVSARGPVAW